MSHYHSIEGSTLRGREERRHWLMAFTTIWSLERLGRALLSESLTCKKLRATLSREQPLRSQTIHPRDTHLLFTHDRGQTAPWMFHWNISQSLLGFGFSLPHLVSRVNPKSIQSLQSHPPSSSLTHSIALSKDVCLTSNVSHGEAVTSWDIILYFTLMLLGKYILAIG